MSSRRRTRVSEATSIDELAALVAGAWMRLRHARPPNYEKEMKAADATRISIL
jgi:hypothetical protein